MDRERRADRWTRRCCDVAVRVVTVSAALCPALSSVGASVVAVLVALLGLGLRGRPARSLPPGRRFGALLTRHRGSHDEAVTKSPSVPGRVAGPGLPARQDELSKPARARHVS